MIGEFVPFGEDAAGEFRLRAKLAADDEEGRMGVVTGERIEHLRGHFWIGSIVEGEGYTSAIARAMGDDREKSAGAGAEHPIEKRGRNHDEGDAETPAGESKNCDGAGYDCGGDEGKRDGAGADKM